MRDDHHHPQQQQEGGGEVGQENLVRTFVNFREQMSLLWTVCMTFLRMSYLLVQGAHLFCADMEAGEESRREEIRTFNLCDKVGCLH